MDSDRRLHYLSWNPALWYDAMSLFSPSSSQTMVHTTHSALASGSLLGVEEDEDKEEDEVNGKDEGARGGVLALRTTEQ